MLLVEYPANSTLAGHDSEGSSQQIPPDFSVIHPPADQLPVQPNSFEGSRVGIDTLQLSGVPRLESDMQLTMEPTLQRSDFLQEFRCSCGNSFSSQHGLTRHRMVCDGVGQENAASKPLIYTCNLCFRKFRLVYFCFDLVPSFLSFQRGALFKAARWKQEVSK